MFDIETKLNNEFKYFKVKINNIDKFKYFILNNNNEKFKDLTTAYYHVYSKKIVFSKKRNSSDKYINIIVKQKEYIKSHKILKLFTYKKTKIIEYELIAEFEKTHPDAILVKIYNNNTYNLLYSFCKNWAEDNEISLIYDVKDINNIITILRNKYVKWFYENEYKYQENT
jgi:hypothetical protein